MKDVEVAYQQEVAFASTVAKISALSGAFLLGSDLNTAHMTVSTAIEENFAHFVVAAGLIGFEVWAEQNPEKWAEIKDWMVETIHAQTGLPREEIYQMSATAGELMSYVDKLTGKGLLKGGAKKLLKSAKSIVKRGNKNVAKDATQFIQPKAGAKPKGISKPSNSNEPNIELVSSDKKVSIQRTQQGNVKDFQVKKGDQPWKIREGQEWKTKVFGKAQKTGTDGHQFRTYREGIKLAKQEKVEVVSLDRGVNRFLNKGEKIKPNRRPGIAYRTNDGKINQIEVPSKTDNPKKLEQRMEDTNRQLPKQMRGEFENKFITNRKKND